MSLNFKIALIFLNSCICLNVNAQFANEIIEKDFLLFSEKYTAKLSYENHTPVKPFIYTDLNILDSAQFGFLKILNNNWDEPKNLRFFASPLVETSYSKDFAIDSSYFGLGAGLRLAVNYKNKWLGAADYYTANASSPEFIGNQSANAKIVPSLGYAHPTSLGYSYNRISGFIAYIPNKFFEFKAGVGKNFIGDGYRSLLLSDNAFQYPFFRINTSFWKLRYTNLFCMMDDIRSANGYNSNYTKKFTSIHYLNWNISKRVSVGIFESIVWQAKDSLYNRQFDVNYLNPIIFYRPIEYSLGSSDNALLGMNAKLKITNHYQLYAQFILDEFLLEEVLDARGWWANKYGVQFGVKAIEPFKLKGLFVQSEFNIVRPFTYSHGQVVQNYGHFNQPLAHPLGANFWESISLVRYNFKNVIISNQTNVALFGTDSSYINLGGNIYQSYSNRDREYYHRIGQGIANNLFYNKFSVSFLIDPKINLRIELAHIYRHITTQFDSNTNHYLSISLKTNLWNSYTDY